MSDVTRILSEIERTKAGGVDMATAQRAGAVIGAEYLLFGTAETYLGQMHIHARLIRTETTEYVVVESISGEPKDANNLAAQLAQRFRI